jgi:hypothetical protein
VRSEKLEVGSGKWEGKREVGSGKREAGSRKWEAGSRKRKAGSDKREVRSEEEREECIRAGKKKYRGREARRQGGRGKE